MKEFTVLKTENPIIAPIVVVKNGWSFPATFFMGVWALISGIWWLFGVIAMIGIVSAFIQIGMGLGSDANTLGLIIGISTAIWVGSKGNQYLLEQKIQMGYKISGTVIAKNKMEALLMVANKI